MDDCRYAAEMIPFNESGKKAGAMHRGILTWAVIWGGLTGFLFTSQHAFGQAPAESDLTVHKGQCSTFQIGDKKHDCPKALHTYYPKSARHSFAFDIPDGLISLSGPPPKFSQPNILLTLQIDSVLVLQDDARDVKKNPATGVCRAKFSEDRKRLEELSCEAHLKTTKVDIKFTGGGEDGRELKSQSIAEGVERFYTVYQSVGIQGVVAELPECYKKIKYGGDIEPLARCFAMDYVAYMIDSGFSGLFGTSNNKYTGSDKMVARAKSNLKKFGYDNNAAERQIISWVDKIKDWMRETGHL